MPQVGLAQHNLTEVYFPSPLAAELRAVLESQSQKKADLEEAAPLEARRELRLLNRRFRPSSRWPA